MRRRHNERARKNKTKAIFLTQPTSHVWARPWMMLGTDLDAWYERNNVIDHFRHMHSTQEKRWNQLTEDEIDVGITIRGRRRKYNLRCYWDDVLAGHQYDCSRKSWKHNSKRKNQWKYE